MQTTYSLRRFQPSDLEQVMYINRTCLPENYTPSFFMELYESYPATFIVAEENDEVVGYIMCRIESGVPGLNFLGKKGHVVSIAVLPQHQRKGIGYALLQEAMRNMVYYKAKECYLEVRTSNEAAISLYKKLGFKIARTLHGYYADGEAAYVMTRKLAQQDSP
ncbi:MAG: ribosomal protein S18-alanine N-acetyltransferase [Candidatus Bathyarchaeia archaeon]